MISGDIMTCRAAVLESASHIYAQLKEFDQARLLAKQAVQVYARDYNYTKVETVSEFLNEIEKMVRSDRETCQKYLSSFRLCSGCIKVVSVSLLFRI